MTKKLTTCILIAAVLGVVAIPSTGAAASYDDRVGVVNFEMTNGDVLAPQEGVVGLRTVKYVRIITACGAGKHYTLKKGTTANGTVLWEEFGTKDVYNTALASGTTQTIQFATNFTLPEDGIFLETDDSATSAEGLYLYTAHGN